MTTRREKDKRAQQDRFYGAERRSKSQQKRLAAQQQSQLTGTADPLGAKCDPPCPPTPPEPPEAA
jgi:hypothetical protein